MKSRITIDFRGVDAMPSGQQFEPVIRVIIEDSEDVRDRLMKSFFESLRGKSSWLEVKFDHHVIRPEVGTKTYLTLTPVGPDSLEDMSREIFIRLKSDSDAKNKTGFGPENYNPLVEEK